MVNVIAWHWWARVHFLGEGIPLISCKIYLRTNFLVLCDSQIINRALVESKKDRVFPWAPENTHLLKPYRYVLWESNSHPRLQGMLNWVEPRAKLETHKKVQKHKTQSSLNKRGEETEKSKRDTKHGIQAAGKMLFSATVLYIPCKM